MCVIFSPVNSIKYIYHSNKYLVRCMQKACSNTCQSVWKPSIIMLFWPNWNAWKNFSKTLHDHVSCFSSCYMWTDMDGLTEMESKEARIYTFICDPTQQIHNFECPLFLPCTFNLLLSHWICYWYSDMSKNWKVYYRLCILCSFLY